MANKTKISLPFLASGVLALIITAYLWQGGHWPRKTDPPSGPVEKLTIGAVLSTTSSLLVVTQEKGYFRDNGLEVTLKFFPTGPPEREQLETGKIDLATFTDFVLVGEIFRGAPSLRCLGTISAADINQMLARKDRGILQPGDLKGRKIGVARGTIAEFFLGRFLTFNRIGLGEVQIVNLRPGDIGAALADGRVDAAMVWEPITYDIMRQMGENLVSWRGQAQQKFYTVLVSTAGFGKARPVALERLFHALAQGSSFIRDNREESQAIIAKWINLKPSVFEHDWLNSDYELALDQGLLISMEDQARWMMHHKLTKQTRLPDFLDYFEAEPLTKAVPEAMRVVIPKNEPRARQQPSSGQEG